MAKGPQLLLCIKSSFRQPGVIKGLVYTLAANVSCPCGIGPSLTVLECPTFPVRLRCKGCKAIYTGIRWPWSAKRFIPLNDPDTKLDDDVANSDNQKKPTEVLATQGELGRVIERSSTP